MFRSEFSFLTTRELEYLFFPEFNIRLYDKNSESDYFFSSTKIRIFFSATNSKGNQEWTIQILFCRRRQCQVNLYTYTHIDDESKLNNYKRYRCKSGNEINLLADVLKVPGVYGA
jgi:hypothetical protein